MEEIVKSHAKDLEGLTKHLGKMASLFEAVMEKLLSKEMEYLTNVQREFEEENTKLKESVEEWKARYESKEKELDKLKLGYTKQGKADSERIDEDLLDLLENLDTNGSKLTTPQGFPQSQEIKSEKKVDVRSTSHWVSNSIFPWTVSPDKGRSLMTPPKSRRKGDKSQSRCSKPPYLERKRKTVLSSDGEDSLEMSRKRQDRGGNSMVGSGPVASSSKNHNGRRLGTFGDDESEWDEISLKSGNVFSLSGTLKKSLATSHEKRGWDNAIDLTI